MHVASILIENWGPYRGRHELQLAPIPYAVTSSQDGDAERSNWGGKSMFLEIVPFVLFGTHRHRLEDEWISYGEKEGIVSIGLKTSSSAQSYAAIVTRRRTRGVSTSLDLDLLPGGFKGDEAQKRILEIVGLGAEDFRTTSYFAQGETSGMVRSDPAVRTAMVARWLRLEPLARCALSTLRQQTTAELRASGARSTLSASKDRLARAFAGELESVEDLETELTMAMTRVAEWEAAMTVASDAASGRLLREERVRVGAEGARLLAEHRAEDGKAIAEAVIAAERVRDDAQAELRRCNDAFKSRQAVAKGLFDGRCPVSGGDCPVRDEINAGGVESREWLESAREELAVAASDAQAAIKAYATAAVADGTRTRRAENLRRLQARYRELEPYATAGEEAAPANVAQGNRDRAVQRVSDLKHRIAEAVWASAEVDRVEGELRAHEQDAIVAREASVIFGRAGAQRRLAEGVLGVVVGRANRMLSSAGIELRLDVSWEREGKGLADECSSCGLAYPASAKVKACSCGEARGAKRVQRLDVDLSSRSGAAEDLAGLALSLSAGAWLRGDRASPWSSVFLDEPWAQLDKAHRRAASAYVPALLAAARVEQAFVISHDPASVASLPGRIEIVSDGRWSRVSVR